LAVPHVFARPVNEPQRDSIAKQSRLTMIGDFWPPRQFQRLFEAVRSDRFFSPSQCQSPLSKHVSSEA
jgi:hypothetical protein